MRCMQCGCKPLCNFQLVHQSRLSFSINFKPVSESNWCKLMQIVLTLSDNMVCCSLKIHFARLICSLIALVLPQSQPACSSRQFSQDQFTSHFSLHDNVGSLHQFALFFSPWKTANTTAQIINIINKYNSVSFIARQRSLLWLPRETFLADESSVMK